MKTLSLVAIALLLTACNSIEVRIVTPPEYLTLEVIPEEPPKESEYVYLDLVDKESALAEKFRLQTKNLDKANSQLKSISDWSAKQRKISKDNKE